MMEKKQPKMIATDRKYFIDIIIFTPEYYARSKNQTAKFECIYERVSTNETIIMKLIRNNKTLDLNLVRISDQKNLTGRSSVYRF